MRIGIFTKKQVKAGTELTFDYKFERYGYVYIIIIIIMDNKYIKNTNLK